MGLEQFAKFGSGFGGIAGGAMSLIGGIGSGIQARKNRKLARELAQKQQDFMSSEAEKAYQRNLEMWNKQNAYNSPSAQMARLEAAGLNPQLAYGSLSAGEASQPPAYNPPSVAQPSDALFSNPYEGIERAGTGLTTNALTMAQVAKTRAETKNIEHQNYKIALENVNLLPYQIQDFLDGFAYNKKMRPQALGLAALNMKKAEQDLLIGQKTLEEFTKKLEGLDYENRVKAVDAWFAEQTKDKRLEAACAEYGMSIEKGKHYAEIVRNEILSGQYNAQILYSKMLEESADDDIQIALKGQNKEKGKSLKDDTKTIQYMNEPNTVVGKVTSGVRKVAGLLKYFLSGLADTVSPVTGEVAKVFGSLTKGK